LNELKVSILCVDDEELSLTLRKLVLEKQGFKVVTARSASNAMEILGKSTVDLVLTDQLMPGGNGVELAQQVKECWPELPVVLISGVNEIPAGAEDADLFISKIEGPARMCEMIASVLADCSRRREQASQNGSQRGTN